MTWIFAVTAAAAMGAAGYWIGRHHQEEEAVVPPTPKFREELEKRIGEALDIARETGDAIGVWGPDFPELPDSPLAEDQVAEVRGKVNAAAGIASRVETPPSPGKPGIPPFEMNDLPVGPGRRFLEWLKSQGCVAGARVPVAGAEGQTAYGMLTSNPGQVRVDYELKVLDAGGGIRLVPGVAYLGIHDPPERLLVE